jgi:hypothetical protein
MSDRLRVHLPLLKKILKGKPAVRNKILEEADLELIKCVCECAINVLNANVPLDEKQKSGLSKHKVFLRWLANRKISLKSKKAKLLTQSGAFLLGLLRPVVAALLAELII